MRLDKLIGPVLTLSTASSGLALADVVVDSHLLNRPVATNERLASITPPTITYSNIQFSNQSTTTLDKQSLNYTDHNFDTTNLQQVEIINKHPQSSLVNITKLDEQQQQQAAIPILAPSALISARSFLDQQQQNDDAFGEDHHHNQESSLKESKPKRTQFFSNSIDKQQNVESDKLQVDDYNGKSRAATSIVLHQSLLDQDAAQHFKQKPIMISKSPDGFYIFNNITLRTCRDLLKPQGIDRCTLIDYIEDCVSEDGNIDYVAFFFCTFSPDKMPIALVISIIWLLMLFIATGVTATDFLCPALFMISKTLGLSQNIAGVTFLAFGNMSADIFASINGIRLGKPDLVISVICGSGTMITTMIIGCVFSVKQFQLDKMIFMRDIIFYLAAVVLIMYIFLVPGMIRLQDAISLVGLYLVYISVVTISKYFSNDKPLKSLHGDKKDGETGIEFEGVHVDDDPTASMVVMRRFLFLSEDQPQFKLPIFKLDKTFVEHANHGRNDSIQEISLADSASNINSLTSRTNKSSRRVTLFEDNLFAGQENVNPESANRGTRHSRSTSIMSISKQQLLYLRRASREIRDQSIDFLAAVSPIDIDVWRQQNWGGRTMELIKAPIRLFLLITTPMADIDGKHEWNKPLSVLHCITGPIFVAYAFGFGSTLIGPLVVPLWLFIIMAPMSALIIFTSSSETPPFYYNAYSSYLGFVVAITWIYTISSEVINLLRAVGIAFNLSSEIMGLTILAWGNCMLDFITNISIARKGLPKMAVAACYGGPLMSHLLGIGLPSLIVLLIDPKHPTKLGSSPLIYVMFAFLIIGLTSTILVTTVMKFRASKGLGIYLITLYAIMAISVWLIELKVIDLDFIRY